MPPESKIIDPFDVVAPCIKAAMARAIAIHDQSEEAIKRADVAQAEAGNTACAAAALVSVEPLAFTANGDRKQLLDAANDNIQKIINSLTQLILELRKHSLNTQLDMESKTIDWRTHKEMQQTIVLLNIIFPKRSICNPNEAHKAIQKYQHLAQHTTLGNKVSRAMLSLAAAVTTFITIFFIGIAAGLTGSAAALIIAAAASAAIASVVTYNGLRQTSFFKPLYQDQKMTVAKSLTSLVVDQQKVEKTR
jgi:hypothetical protein